MAEVDSYCGLPPNFPFSRNSSPHLRETTPSPTPPRCSHWSNQLYLWPKRWPHSPHFPFNWSSLSQRPNLVQAPIISHLDYCNRQLVPLLPPLSLYSSFSTQKPELNADQIMLLFLAKHSSGCPPHTLKVKVFTMTHKAPWNLPYLPGLISHSRSPCSLQFSLSGLAGVPHTCQVHTHLTSFALAIVSNSSYLHGSTPLFLQVFAQMSFPS